MAFSAASDALWVRALQMLRCHREGVPTLLGLCVVNVAQYGLTRTLQSSKSTVGTVRTVEDLPTGLRQYISKLQEWAKPRVVQVQQKQPRSQERVRYGACPKTPHKHELSWIEAADALQRMKLLSDANIPLADADRYNINKFLNRLLGLPVSTQNALFAFYTSVFRWVAVAVKAQGKMETGVAVIEGESVERASEPEVLYSDPKSNAVTLVHSLRVDTGLAWTSAMRVWMDALNDAAIKSTQYGGSTGFWRQSISKRIVLAIEMPSSSSGSSSILRFHALPPSYSLFLTFCFTLPLKCCPRAQTAPRVSTACCARPRTRQPSRSTCPRPS